MQPGPAGSGDAPFALTDAAVRIGDRRLVWRDASYPHAALHAFLGRWIYRDHTLAELLRPALWGGLVVLAGGPAGRGAEGCRARARPATGAPAQGARARLRRAVQSAVSRRRHRLRAAAADVPPIRVGPRPARDRVEPLPHHGGLGHREVRVDPADVDADRGARRDRHRLRPGARIHAAVLHARARRRDPQSARCAESLLDTGRRVAARGGNAHARDVVVSRPAPRECVLHRSAATHLRAPADAPTDAGATGLVAVPRRRDRPAAGRDGLRRHDRPAGAGPAERRAGLAQHGGRHAQAPARRSGTRRAAGAPRPGRTRGPTAGSSSPARRKRARASCRSPACGWTRWCCA